MKITQWITSAAAALLIGMAAVSSLVPLSGASGGSAVMVPSNPLTTSAATLVHPNGTNRAFAAAADSNAARGAALLAAESAAASGDTILVAPGTYAITSGLAKNGVNYSGGSGVTISWSQSVNGFIFDASGGKSFNVDGAMNFVRTMPDDNPTTLLGAGILNMGADAGTVNFHFTKADFEVTAATANNLLAGSAITAHGGRLHFSGDWLTNTDPLTGSYVVWWEDGTVDGRGEYLSSFTGGSDNGQCATSVISATATGHLRLDFDEIYADGEGSAINTSIAGGSPTVAVWVICNTITGGASVTGGKTYLTAQKVIGPITCSGGILYLDLIKQGNPLVNPAPYINVTGGTLRATVGQFEPSGNVQELVYVHGSSAVAYLTGQDFTANAGQNALRCSSGTLNVLGGRITSDSGKLDLLQTGSATINVMKGSVHYNGAKTSGVITNDSTP